MLTERRERKEIITNLAKISQSKKKKLESLFKRNLYESEVKIEQDQNLII